MTERVIFLDRDGVINHDSHHYIKSVDELILIQKHLEAIVLLTKAGYRVGVATNQSGVSRGLYTEETLAAIHDKMVREIQAAGGRIDAIEYCIHMPDSGCPCRKPAPGMLLGLAKKLHCSTKQVPFVGDRVSDIQAALAVGAKPVMVLSQMTDRDALKNYPDVPVYHSLNEYVDQLLMQTS